MWLSALLSRASTSDMSLPITCSNIQSVLNYRSFCTSCSLYGYNCSRFRRIFLTVGSNIFNSRLALRQWHTQEFCLGGGSTNSVEDRQNEDLGAVAP